MLEQDAGAMRAVFGDRADDERDGAPPAFASQAIHTLTALGLGGRDLKPGPVSELELVPVNALIQAVGAFEPTDELEGMIAVQAAALHFVMMDCLLRGMTTGRNEFRQSHLGQANKCARTFGMLVETLNRHRGKVTTQKVIVENVTVEAGGQAVVGAVTGVGSKQKGAVRAHGQSEIKEPSHDESCAGRAALPGPESNRQSVSEAGVKGQEALPHARGRSRKRCAERQPESSGPRSLHRSRRTDAQGREGDASKRARLDGVAQAQPKGTR